METLITPVYRPDQVSLGEMLWDHDTEYVDIISSPGQPQPTNFYEKWVDQSSAKHTIPELVAADALRSFFPDHSLVVSEDYRLNNLLTLPDILVHPPDSKEASLQQLLNVVFRPTSRRVAGEAAGSLADEAIFGTFNLTWSGSDFIVHVTRFQVANFIKTAYFILHQGPEQRARDLVLATCRHAEQIHDEIWVFNRGFWSKDQALWRDIKGASWDDVIMKEDSKQTLQKDIDGFFKSEETYKKLSIPWKRGLILYGPPGNGKTISIKAIINTCIERDFVPLYVKSFQSPMGEEAAMQTVFSQTRQLAPCVLILEDLDSLINSRNRSFFLNQLDGLEGNDGLLVIATTNHFDQLDPGLSSRPSRFDRRYLFDDPDYQSRELYVKYWQGKLKHNDDISFPNSLVQEIANLTEGFSFAYLKEAFVSALVRITDIDAGKQEFSVVLKDQIAILRKELGKQTQVTPEPHTSPEADVRESKESALLTQVIAQPGPDVAPGLQWYPSPGSRLRPFLRGSNLRQPQIQVHHAPSFAYPQVMPGYMPGASPDSLKTLGPAAKTGVGISNNDMSPSQRGPAAAAVRPGRIDGGEVRAE